jgi:hypothetical protein
MLTIFCRRWPIGLLASIHVLGAHATGHEQAMPAKLQYTSALEGYRSFADEPKQPWVETNEVVRRIGGWRTYAAERSAGTAEPGPDSGQSSPPAPERPEGSTNPHAGHGSRP